MTTRHFILMHACIRIAIAVAIALAVLLVVPSLGAEECGSPPVEYWELPTGSHLGYVKIASPRQPAERALVLLHGGPGANEVFSYTFACRWYERLAALSYDVYLYDQIGSGVSARLADPREYTVARHLADLEAIRQQLGRARMTIIGESWGATLAANYLATHPDRVERAIFVAPGMLEPAEWKATAFPYATPRVAREFLGWVARTRDGATLQRCTLLDALLQRGDIRAAYELAGDREMDPLMDAFVAENILALCVHDRARLDARHFELPGMGWWASLMTMVDGVSTHRGVRARLAACETPVLILRGESDYLPAEIAAQYVRAFRDATFVRIPAAGHFIWMDQPERYRDEMLAFLTPKSAWVEDAARRALRAE